jgi:acid phosphatase type 7
VARWPPARKGYSAAMPYVDLAAMTARLRGAALLVAAALAAAAAGCGNSTAPADSPSPPPQRAVVGPSLVAAGDVACAGSEPNTRFTCRQSDTAALIARLDPDVVAALGDLQYPAGGLADFEASFDRSWGRFKNRMRPAIGNHEYEQDPAAAGYFSYFGQRAGPIGKGWYAYDIGDWRVVALNANCDRVGCGTGSAQQRWLRADLERHPRRCTLAYWHQPRFSSGLHGSNDDTAALWRTLQQAGADVVLSGHDHDYERFAPQTAGGRLDRSHGIVQFVVGTGGKSSYPILFVRPHSRARASTFGVLALTLGADRYAWRFVGEPGERFRDQGTARCH